MFFYILVHIARFLLVHFLQLAVQLALQLAEQLFVVVQLAAQRHP